MKWASLTHSSVSKADSSPNLGEQPEIHSASDTAGDNASDPASDCGSHSSPKLGEVARMAGGVCKSPYWAIAGLYLLLLTVLKVVEFFLWDIHAPNAFQVLVNAVAYNLVVASWVVLAVSLLYWLVQLLSRRVAVVLAALFYALWLYAEVGLLFYTLHNGYLLGCELLARPLSESLAAIRGAMGVALPILLTIVLPGSFIALALWRARHASRAVWALPAVVALFMLLSLIFKPSHLVMGNYSYYILNKTHFLCVDSFNYLRHPSGGGAYSDTPPDYDPALVAHLLASHPEWGSPLDSLYPLERPFSPDTFLNPWFLPSPTPPNIVIILVESLGHEYMGTGAMPFVDSLAATGLYWPNCLSTTTRSYGAIPAITGSVGGPKSFQFGTMPAHNSLLSLLKAAGYNTRAYYAGDFSFDCIYDYLAAQHIDYLSPLFEEYNALPNDQKTTWWGYHDDTLFARTLRNLNQFSIFNSQFSIITTLSMHDPLALPDTARQASYERRAAQLSILNSQLSIIPACLFTDDALRLFFQGYSQRPDFAGTLFVITGDHASGRQGGDRLSYHHVPLILWSPLVREPKSFSHTVTHNDIAPALYSLLVSRYGLAPQPTVHWLGDGLGPTPKTLPVVNYAQHISDIIYHNHYYQAGDHFNPEAVYTFGTDMLLHPDANPALLDTCRRQLALMRYLYTYTYLADRLTAHPLARQSYTPSHTLRLPESFTCTSPDAPPSIAGRNTVTLLPALRLQGRQGATSVRVTLQATCTAEGIDDFHQYPALRITCQTNSRYQYENDLYRLFVADGHIKAVKEFALSPDGTGSLYIELLTPYADTDWKPLSSVTLSNIQITIEYGQSDNQTIRQSDNPNILKK